MFDQNFMNFMEKILTKIIEDNKSSTKNYQELIKICFLYFFTVLVRSKEKENVSNFLKSLKNILSTNVDISNWFLSCLSNENILRETLIECPWREMKSVFLELIKTAIKNIDNNEKNAEFSSFKCGNLAKFISSAIFVLYESRGRKKLMDHFYKLFNYFSHCSKNCIQQLIKVKFVGRVWYYLNDTHPPTNIYIDYKEFRIIDCLKDLGIPNKDQDNGLIKSFEEIAEKKKRKII